MDASPESTVILRTLKNVDKLINSGCRARDSFDCNKHLSFSDSRISSSSTLHDSYRLGDLDTFPRKRQHDSLAGLDITKKFRQQESEIVSSRATITRLEGRIRDLETERRKACVERETETEAFKLRQRRDKELIDDLQHKLKKVQWRERETEESAGRVRRESDTRTLDIEARLLHLQQDHLTKTTRLQEEVTTLQEKVLKLEKEVEEKQAKLIVAESRKEDLEERLEEAEKKVREAGDSQAECEAHRQQLHHTRAKVKDLELRLQQLEMYERKAEVFEGAVGKVQAMEKKIAKLTEANQFLRDTALNTQLLEEKLAGAQRQVEGLEKQCQNTAHLQAQLELCQANLDKYERVTREECGVEGLVTAEELQGLITRLRKGDQAVTDSITQVQASHKLLKSSREQQEEQLRVLKGQLEKQQQHTQQNATLVKRLQRKLLLVTKERESVKNVIDSYEAEVTINYSAVSQKRIQCLENQLELYRKELQRLEAELEGSQQGPSPTSQQQQGQASREAEKKVGGLEKRVAELEAEVARLQQEKEGLELRLEHRALKGDYNPTTTKVLHFRDNPLSRAIEQRGTEIEQLRAEKDSLKERVRLLEQGETHNLTQQVGRVAEAHSSKEVQELREKVGLLERRSKRLMEAFKHKSREMREVVYYLTGYRVDASGDSQYKLLNIYAESPDDFLLFQQSADKKELQLLETEFSRTLEDQIDSYLRHRNSFPAFLSAVTLDLFSRQTIMQQPASSSDCEEEEEEHDDEEEEEDDDEEEVGEVEEVDVENEQDEEMAGEETGEEDDVDLVIVD